MPMFKPAPGDAVPLHRKRKRLKAVAIVPSLLTLGNLLSGFAAVYFCMRVAFGAGANIDPTAVKTLNSELFERLWISFLSIGAWCIALGMLFDSLDGRIARMQNVTSKFGVELDSLADLVTFGIAPACLIVALVMQCKHEWPISLLPVDAIGRGRWLLLGLYVSCVAIRLARFNVETGTEESAHRKFKGLPSPAAGGTIAALIVAHERLYYHTVPSYPWIQPLCNFIPKALPFIAGFLALMMVSRIPFTHLVTVYLRGRKPVNHVVIGLAFVLVFIMNPEFTASVFMLVYVLSGPVQWCIRRLLGQSQTPLSDEGIHATAPMNTSPDNQQHTA